MGAFAAGQVVLVRLPFSDLTRATLRPAVVLANAGRNDWVLCQVTSQPYAEPRAVQIQETDFVAGSLRVVSYARPGKSFTAHVSLIAGRIGELAAGKSAEVRDAIVRLILAG